MEMEITIRTWAILIHNYVLTILAVLLHYAIMSFMHRIEVERSIPQKIVSYHALPTKPCIVQSHVRLMVGL